MVDTVTELVQKLSQFDSDLVVEMNFDSGCFQFIEDVWINDIGTVVLTESTEPCTVCEILKKLSLLPQEALFNIHFDSGCFRDIEKIEFFEDRNTVVLVE